MIKKYNIYYILLLFVFIFTQSCSKTDPETGEKVLIEPNPQKRAEAARDASGGILGNIGKSGNNQTTVNFATTNVLGLLAGRPAHDGPGGVG